MTRSTDRPAAVEGVTYLYVDAGNVECPKDRRWLSVRDDGIIVGVRLSTAGEEQRFAQAALYAAEQSDFETAVTTDDDFEDAFRGRK